MIPYLSRLICCQSALRFGWQLQLNSSIIWTESAFSNLAFVYRNFSSLSNLAPATGTGPVTWPARQPIAQSSVCYLACTQRFNWAKCVDASSIFFLRRRCEQYFLDGISFSFFFLRFPKFGILWKVIFQLIAHLHLAVRFTNVNSEQNWDSEKKITLP